MSLSKSVALGVEVERLRAENERLLFDIGELVTSREIARNERDRLQAELDALGGVHTCSPGCEKTAICRMTNERDRLREALTTIKDLPDLSGFGASHETIFQMRCIARAALKENNE